MFFFKKKHCFLQHKIKNSSRDRQTRTGSESTNSTPSSSTDRIADPTARAATRSSPGSAKNAPNTAWKRWLRKRELRRRPTTREGYFKLRAEALLSPGQEDARPLYLGQASGPSLTRGQAGAPGTTPKTKNRDFFICCLCISSLAKK